MATRILLFTGKGGVGKTTCAAATALEAARRGHRTLVVSSDPAHSLADALDQTLGPEPVAVAENLWAQEVDLYYSMQKYWSSMRDLMLSVFKWQGVDRIAAEEMAALPGMGEASALLWLDKFYRSGDYDLIVLDSAPTGETLTLLTLPQVAQWWVSKAFPFQKTAFKLGGFAVRKTTGIPLDRGYAELDRLFGVLGEMQTVLQDSAVASTRLVVNPERMVIAEARRAYTYLQLYGYGVDAVVVNRIIPEDGAGSVLAKYVEAQAGYLDEIEGSFSPLPIFRVPHVGQEVFGLGLLREIGAGALLSARPSGRVLRRAGVPDGGRRRRLRALGPPPVPERRRGDRRAVRRRARGAGPQPAPELRPAELPSLLPPRRGGARRRLAPRPLRGAGHGGGVGAAASPAHESSHHRARTSARGDDSIIALFPFSSSAPTMRLLATLLVLAALAVPASAQSLPSLPANPDALKAWDDGTPTEASGGDALNATLLGRLDERQNYGDLWGYVDPATGREYALLTARYSGLSVIDLDTPTPTEVGFVRGLRLNLGLVADAKDVKTYGRYAYLAHEYKDLLVIDLADPTDPTVAGRINLQSDVSSNGSHNILVEGDYLYVVGGSSPGGLRIYDLGADPVDPPLVGTYDGPFGGVYYHDLDVVGDLAYAAAIYNRGIDVIDLSDRSDPELITTIIYPTSGSMGAHNVCAAPDGETIFVGDEIGSGPWTRAFDVRDLDDPELLSELIVDERAVVHNCYVKGDFIYLAHYTEGLQVFDVSDPANPERVAFYDTYPASGFGFNGAWTAYPYLPSGRVIVSDLSGGLFVIDVDLPGSGAEVTLTAEATSPLTVAPGGAVSFAYTVTNGGTAAVTGDLFFTAERGGAAVAQGTILSGTLAAGQSQSGTYTQQVSPTAPAGAYTYTLKVGRFPASALVAVPFAITVTGPSLAGASAAWTATDATPWGSASETLTAQRAAAPVPDVAAFPNPFAGTTTLRFGLEAASAVRLAVYDVLGREVAVLVEGVVEAGVHEALFSGRDLPSGAYVWRLEADGAVQTGQMTLLR